MLKAALEMTLGTSSVPSIKETQPNEFPPAAPVLTRIRVCYGEVVSRNSDDCLGTINDPPGALVPLYHQLYGLLRNHETGSYLSPFSPQETSEGDRVRARNVHP